MTICTRSSGNVGLDYLQLHGEESPERVAQIKKMTRLPAIKAISVGFAADLDAVAAYEKVADMLLFDARPPAGARQKGGNGVSFDWSLLPGHTGHAQWMLAGGLNPDNVGEGHSHLRREDRGRILRRRNRTRAQGYRLD